MLASLRSAALLGVDAFPVHVEVDVSLGMPSFTMVGLPDASVRESRDRVRSAIRNSGFEFPAHRITINLAPADMRKAGASFDLPIALGILAASGRLDRRRVTEWLLLGELSLDGGIQPTRGVLAIAVAAQREGLAGLIVPVSNAPEAAAVAGLRVVPVSSLIEALDALNHPSSAPPSPGPPVWPACDQPASDDFVEVRGQTLVRRALEIAAAGGHNVLMIGPPGSGKTMMARRLPGILPVLTRDEALEVTAIHSVAGLLPPGAGLVSQRPFRAPHHTISHVALVGGGTIPRPGEISLAHHGVLFLDEAAEFERRTLEVLRQPLEEGRITVARAARTVGFPAGFMLVMAMNPCPCGYRGDERHECRCTPPQVERYHGRLSGPLRDRLDLTVEVSAVPLDALTRALAGESSARIRERVGRARERQRSRARAPEAAVNAKLSGRALERHCALDRDGVRLLESASRRLALSARSFDRVLRVARTIADLGDADAIDASHLAEALLHRATSRLPGRP